MAKIISKNIIEEIRNACDIADVVGSYVQLKRAGSALRGLCPFHKEKTPSFHVNARRQIFHCFGCGAGGDVFKFIMQHESVDFFTAVRMLAQRAGIKIEFDAAEDREAQSKDLLYRINDEVAQFYHRVLVESASGAPAREYLKRRDLGDEVIRDFLLGFAPATSDTMRRWAEKKGFTLEQLESAGLVARREQDDGKSEPYDRFWNRLMFPIRDEQERIIAFSGRILEKDERGAKYLNSPETALFRKSRVLYAMDKARRDILESRTALLCEGQIDVIRCHGAGLTTAVAALGTAITEDHARLLKRYADTVVLVLDADTAGQNSAIRSADIFLGKDLSVSVAVLPPGEDPDSLIRKQGREGLQKLIDGSKTALDFQIDVLSSRENIKTGAGLKRVTQTVLESISHIPTAAVREKLIKQASDKLKVTQDTLRHDLDQFLKKRQIGTIEADRFTMSIPEHPPEEVQLAKLLASHAECAELVLTYIKDDHLSDPECRIIIRHLLDHSSSSESNLMAELTEQSDECRRLAAEILASQSKVIGTESTPIHAAQDLILFIRRKALERRRRELEQIRDKSSGIEHARIVAELAQLVLDIKMLHHGWERAHPILELSVG